LGETAGVGTETNGDNSSAGGNMEGGGNGDRLGVSTIVKIDLSRVGISFVVRNSGSGVAVESEANDDGVACCGGIGKLEMIAIRARKSVVDRATAG
jgi:hypothetical protein